MSIEDYWWLAWWWLSLLINITLVCSTLDCYVSAVWILNRDSWSGFWRNSIKFVFSFYVPSNLFWTKETTKISSVASLLFKKKLCFQLRNPTQKLERVQKKKYKSVFAEHSLFLKISFTQLINPAQRVTRQKKRWRNASVS